MGPYTSYNVKGVQVITCTTNFFFRNFTKRFSSRVSKTSQETFMYFSHHHHLICTFEDYRSTSIGYGSTFGMIIIYRFRLTLYTLTRFKNIY